MLRRFDADGVYKFFYIQALVGETEEGTRNGYFGRALVVNDANQLMIGENKIYCNFGQNSLDFCQVVGCFRSLATEMNSSFRTKVRQQANLLD